MRVVEVLGLVPFLSAWEQGKDGEHLPIINVKRGEYGNWTEYTLCFYQRIDMPGAKP